MLSNDTDPKKKKNVVSTATPDISKALENYAQKNNITVGDNAPILQETRVNRETKGGTVSSLDSQNRVVALRQASLRQAEQKRKEQEEKVKLANLNKLKSDTATAEEFTKAVQPQLEAYKKKEAENPYKEKIGKLKNDITARNRALAVANAPYDVRESDGIVLDLKKQIAEAEREALAYNQGILEELQKSLPEQSLNKIIEGYGNVELGKIKSQASLNRIVRHLKSETSKYHANKAIEETKDGNWFTRNIIGKGSSLIYNIESGIFEGLENAFMAVSGEEVSEEEKTVNAISKPLSVINEISLIETMQNLQKAKMSLESENKISRQNRAIYKTTMSNLQRQKDVLLDVRKETGFSPAKLWEGIVGDNILNFNETEETGYIFLKNARKNLSELYYDDVTNVAEDTFQEYLKLSRKKAEEVTNEEYKTNVFDKLNPLYQEALKAKGVLQEVEQYNHENGSYWYKSIQGVAFSAEMMASMMGGIGVVSLGSKALKGAGMSMNIVNNVNRASRLRGYLIGMGASEKASSFGLKTLQAGQKLGKFGIESAVSTYLDPLFINERLRKEVNLLRDEETGEIDLAMTGDALRGRYVRGFEEERKNLNLLVSKLSAKGSLSKEEEQTLAYAKARLGQGSFIDPDTMEEIESIDADLEMVNETPESVFTSHLKGILLTANERFSELYTSKALGAVGKGLDKGLVKFANKPYAFVKDKINKFSDYASYDTMLGRTYNGFTRGVKEFTTFDGMPIIGSIPGEIVEEYVAQLGQGVIDWSIEPLKEAASIDFMKDVAAQTLILNGFMGGAGTGYKNIKLGHNKLVQNRLEKLNKNLAVLEKAKANATPAEQKDYAQAISSLKKDIATATKNNSLTGTGLATSILGNTSEYAKRNQEAKELDTLFRELKSFGDEKTSKAISFINSLSRDARTEGEKAQQISELRFKGKNVEADLVEKSMMTTMINRASNSDTLGELRHSLEKALSKVENLDTIKNLQTTLGIIDKAEKFKEENPDNPNKNLVTRFLTEDGLLDATIEQTKSTLQSGKASASTEFQDLFETEFADQTEVSFAEAEQLFLSGNLSRANNESEAKAEVIAKIAQAVNDSSSPTLRGYTMGMEQERAHKRRKVEIRKALTDLTNPSISTANAELFIKGLNKKHKELANLSEDGEITEEQFKQMFDDFAQEWTSSIAGKVFRRIDKVELEKIKNNGVSLIRAGVQRREFITAMQNRHNTIQNVPDEDVEITQYTGTHAEMATRDAISQMEGEVFGDPVVNQSGQSKEVKILTPEEILAIVNPVNIEPISSGNAEDTDSDGIPKTVVEDNPFAEDMNLMLPSDEFSFNPELLESITQGLTKVVKYLNLQTGQPVTFTQAIKTIIAFESQAGKLVFEGTRYRYFIQAWQDLGGPFNEGEQYALFNEVTTRAEELRGKGEIFEVMRDSYLEKNPFNTNIDTTPLAQSSISTILEEKQRQERKEDEIENPPAPPVTAKEEVETPEKVGAEETETVGLGTSLGVFGQTAKEIEEEVFEVTNRADILNGKSPKLGFSAIAYENYVDENGVIGRRSVNTETMNVDNAEGKDMIQVNPKPLLHPDNTSFDLTVEISDEADWDKIKVFSEFIDDIGNVRTLTFAQYVALKVKENPNYIGSPEFMEKVPVFAVKDGVRVAYIHDSDWFNPYNVKDPTIRRDASGNILNYTHPRDYETNPLWVKAIEDDKARNNRLRTAILKHGVKSLKYRKNSEGKHGEFGNNELGTIKESNSQAILIVQSGLNMRDVEANDLPKEFGKDGDSILINDKADFDTDTKTGKPLNKNGHTWALYRIGTVVTEKGEVKKTYRALPVYRNQSLSYDMMDSIQWAIAIHTVLNGAKVPTKYGMTPELAELYRKNFSNITGLDLKEQKSVEAYIGNFAKLTPQALEEVNSDMRNKGYQGNNKSFDFFALKKALFETAGTRKNGPPEPSVALERVVQATHKASLNNKDYRVAMIGPSGVTPYVTQDGKPASYKEFLMENLSTSQKAYNMAEQGKSPVYSLVVQPILEIEDQFEGVQFDIQPASTSVVTTSLRKASQQAIAETTPTTVTPLSETEQNEVLDFLSRSMGINIDMFGDDAFGDIETLNSLFEQITELRLRHENIVVGYLESIITEKANYRERISSSNLEEIRAVAKRRLQTSLAFIKKDLLESLKKLEVTPESPKTQVVTQAIQKALSDMQEIENNYLALFDKAVKRVEIISNINLDSLEEIENEDLSDEELSEKNYSRDSIEETVKSKAGAKLRMLFSGMPVLVKSGKKDAQGNDEYVPEIGYANLPRMMSLDDVYNLVLKTLSVGTDLTGDFDVMVKKLENSSNPIMKEVLARLMNSDAQVKNQFVVNSAMHSLTSRFAMYENSKDGKVQLKYYDTNSSTVKEAVKKKWIQNTFATELYDNDGNFNRVYARSLIEEFMSFEPSFEKVTNLSQIRTWLEKVGIELHDKTWEQVLGQGITISNKQYFIDTMYDATFTAREGSDPMSIFHKVLSFLRKAEEKPEEYGVDGTSLYKDMVGIANGFAEIEAINNPELISLVFRDTGKTISTLTPPKYITDAVAKLINSAKGDQAEINEILSFAFSSESLLLETLRDRPDFVAEFGIHHIALTAIKERNEKLVKNKKMPSLDMVDYFLTAFTAFQDRKRAQFDSKIPATKNMIPLRIADMISPTMSDKDTALSMTTVVLDTLRQATLLYDKNEAGEISLGSKLQDILYQQVVRPELKKIWEKHNKKLTSNVKAYDAVSGLFHLIPKLNTVQINGENIVRYLANNAGVLSFERVEELFKTDLTKVMSDVVTQEVKNYVTEFKEVGFQKDTEGNPIKNLLFDEKYYTEADSTLDPVKDFEYGVWDFVVNSFVFNADMFKVFIGDMSVYDKSKKPKDKDIYSLTESEYVEINKESGVNLGKRLALLIAPGRKINNTVKDNKYLQIFLQDSSDIAQNSEQLIKWYYPDVAESVWKPMLEEYRLLYRRKNIVEQYSAHATKVDKKVRLTKAINDRLKVIKNSLSEQFPGIGDYFDIESTDAQEYTTVAEHLHVMYHYGRLSESEYKRLTELFESGQDFSATDLKVVMQPMKPVHTGIYNQAEFGVRRPVYIKTSSFPLVPQVTKGTSLDTLRTEMERLENETGKYVRASYQSGNKVGATINTVNPTDVDSVKQIFTHIAGGSGKVILDNANVVMELDRNNFRIQQDNPYKSGKKKLDQVSMGTQIFKLLLGDGIAQIKEKSFPFKNQMLSGPEITQKFKDSFQIMFDKNLEQLYDELGLPADGTIANEEAFIESLQALLKREALSRNYPIKSVKGLDMRSFSFKQGGVMQEYFDFASPLWLSSDSNKYEALLNSIITNRLMKFKISGNGYIAGSEKGFDFVENINAVKDKNKIVYLSGWNGKELQATTSVDGQIQSAQVMVESKFRDNNGKMIDLFKNFNEETQEGDYIKKDEKGIFTLKEDMFDPDVLKMFTFRTPTSSHVSGSSVQIVGILPPGSGDLMIVPKNFTKQKGLDFDIDKESAYFYNLFVGENGRIEPITDSPEALKAVLGRELIYQEIKETVAEFKSLRNQLRADVNLAKYKKAEVVYQLKMIENELDYLKDLMEEQKDTLYFEEIEANFNILTEEKRLLFNQLLEDKHTMEEIYKTLEQLNLQLDAEKVNIFATVHERVKSRVQRKRVRQFEKKVAENDFIRVHLGVYNSNNNEVQRKINKILSLDYPKKQAENLEKLNEEGAKQARLSQLIAEGATQGEALEQYNSERNSFTVLSYMYQKEKMDLGAIGKTAIGIYAVATTFNGQLQQTFGQGGAPASTFRIGNYTSNSIGQQDTLGDSSYSTSQAFAEKENTATDNEKEQILGRVGVNEETIGVDAYMTLRAFGKDENGNSISYMLVSQPTIKAFNDKKKKSKGILGEYFDTEKEIDNHIQEISGGTIAYGPQPGNPSLNPPTVFYSVETGETLGKEGSPKLTGNEMLRGIREGSSVGNIQVEAFMAFIELKEQGAYMIPVMGAFNTNVIGKSMAEALLKRKRLTKSLFNQDFPDFFKMLGEQVPKGTKGSYTFVDESGMFPKYMTLKPTTPQGIIAIEGLMMHEKLFAKYFPLSMDNFMDLSMNILSQQGIKEDAVTAEDLEGVVREMKKYIFSSSSLGLYKGDAETKRYELFVDDSQNTSLAMYLKKNLKAKSVEYRKGIQALADNLLVGKKLDYEVNKGKDQNSIITFKNASSDFIDDSELYQALLPLILEDMPLPNRNDQPYSTRLLVQDLVAYSFLEGGVQEATQFIKYVPVELYDVMGAEIKTVDGKTKFFSINTLLQYYNPQRSASGINKVFMEEGESFTNQYFQNNPTKAKKVDFSKFKVFSDRVVANEVSTFNYLQTKDNQGQIRLWKKINTFEYREIPVASSFYISQYNLGQKFSTPLGALKRDAPDTREEIPQSEMAMMEALHKATTINEALEIISSTPLTKEFANLPEIAGFMLDYIDYADDSRDFNFDPTFVKAGTTTPDGKVSIRKGDSPEQTIKTIIHEGIHHLTVRELNKYFERGADGSYSLKDSWIDKDNVVQPIPAHIYELNAVYQESIRYITKTLNDKYGSDIVTETFAVQTAYKKAINNGVNNKEFIEAKANLQALLSKIEAEDFSIIYGLTNIKEFMSVLFENPNFRSILDKATYKKTEMSILNKLLTALRKMVTKIFPEITTNSLAEEGLIQSFRFLEIEKAGPKKEAVLKKQTQKLTLAQQALIGKLEQTPPKIEQPPLSSYREYVDSDSAPSQKPTKEELEEGGFEKMGDLSLSLENNINFVKTNIGQSIASLGVLQSEWNELTEEERSKIKECN